MLRAIITVRKDDSGMRIEVYDDGTIRSAFRIVVGLILLDVIVSAMCTVLS